MGVAFHDGDDAAHDATAVVGLFDDVLFERLCEVEVCGLLLGWVVQVVKSFVRIIGADVWVVKGGDSHKRAQSVGDGRDFTLTLALYLR